MAISEALKKSATGFCGKYVCFFSVRAFESKLEEFTFLRPNGGWVDFYKAMFEQLYRKTLERVAMGEVENLDSEAMLDDFEYTLIRPYVQESAEEINHRPYAGMDRLTRLEYLDKIMRNAPSNFVELYAEKYKNGEISSSQMIERARGVLSEGRIKREQYIELASYAQVLDDASQSRSLAWRTIHRSKSNEEKRDAALIKQMIVDRAAGGEQFYRDVAARAHDTFGGFAQIKENLMQSMLRAREEFHRTRKMNDAIRDPLI